MPQAPIYSAATKSWSALRSGRTAGSGTAGKAWTQHSPPPAPRSWGQPSLPVPKLLPSRVYPTVAHSSKLPSSVPPPGVDPARWSVVTAPLVQGTALGRGSISPSRRTDLQGPSALRFTTARRTDAGFPGGQGACGPPQGVGGWSWGGWKSARLGAVSLQRELDLPPQMRVLEAAVFAPELPLNHFKPLELWKAGSTQNGVGKSHPRPTSSLSLLGLAFPPGSSAGPQGKGSRHLWDRLCAAHSSRGDKPPQSP